MFEGIDPNRLAAIVYDDGIAVDALMSAFARELVEAGVAVRGVVQLPPEKGGCGPRAPMRLQVVATGEIMPICQELGPGAGSCCLDTSALADAATMLRRDALQTSDIVLFSKFGKQEANGGGFRAELAFAASEGRTVLTAVKRGLVHKWLEFTGGQGTLLDHHLWVVRNWWADLSYMRGPAA
jgi:nucleoside-triphosphatase THEP1